MTGERTSPHGIVPIEAPSHAAAHVAQASPFCSAEEVGGRTMEEVP